MQNHKDEVPPSRAGVAGGPAVPGSDEGAHALTPDPADVVPGNAARRAPSPRQARAPATAAAVRKQLIRAVQRQATMVDARLAGDGAEVDERDSRILGNLAKTLATLVEIGEGGKRSRDNKEPPDRDHIEDRLAERIKAWARGGA